MSAVEFDWSGVDWSKSDKDIAAETGLTKLKVKAKRGEIRLRQVEESVAKRSRKKPSRYGRKNIDWDQEPLGQMPDLQIARLKNVSVASVRNARLKREIPAFVRETVEFDINPYLQAGLGFIPDAEVARVFNVSTNRIQQIRTKYEIPPTTAQRVLIYFAEDDFEALERQAADMQVTPEALVRGVVLQTLRRTEAEVNTGAYEASA